MCTVYAFSFFGFLLAHGPFRRPFLCQLQGVHCFLLSNVQSLWGLFRYVSVISLVDGRSVQLIHAFFWLIVGLVCGIMASKRHQGAKKPTDADLHRLFANNKRKSNTQQEHRRRMVKTRANITNSRTSSHNLTCQRLCFNLRLQHLKILLLHR